MVADTVCFHSQTRGHITLKPCPIPGIKTSCIFSLQVAETSEARCKLTQTWPCQQVVFGSGSQDQKGHFPDLHSCWQASKATITLLKVFGPRSPGLGVGAVGHPISVFPMQSSWHCTHVFCAFVFSKCSNSPDLCCSLRMVFYIVMARTRVHLWGHVGVSCKWLCVQGFPGSAGGPCGVKGARLCSCLIPTDKLAFLQSGWSEKQGWGWFSELCDYIDNPPVSSSQRERCRTR